MFKLYPSHSRKHRFNQKPDSSKGQSDLEIAIAKVNNDGDDTMKETLPPPPALIDNLLQPQGFVDLSTLKLNTAAPAEQRFGCFLYKGMLGSKPVTIKGFSSPTGQTQQDCPNKKQHYFNEREVYELIGSLNSGHQKNHFLTYFGHGESFTSDDGHVMLQNYIVLESPENGRLSEFLNRTTISWSGLCQMLLSICQGLSYLHGRMKEPSVCHRLVKY